MNPNHLGERLPPPEPSRRELMGGFAAALGAVLFSRKAEAAQPRPPRPPRPKSTTANIIDYGAAEGGFDCTQAFKRAFAVNAVVQVPAGTFAAKQIHIPANKTLLTAGPETVIQQLPHQPSGTSLIRVMGSNVTIGSFTAAGNIASDMHEWMHSIEVKANADTGNLSNVVIGDIFGRNVRGDVICLSAIPGFTLQSVSLGNISGDNVYRNVVTIAGTSPSNANIQIASIRGQRVGLYHFDIEPDDTSPPVIGVTVGEIVGRNVGVVGPNAAAFVDAVSIRSLDLSPDCGGSSPDYITTDHTRPHGLQVRNSKNLSISSLKARGLAGQAIKFIDSTLPTMTMHITSCEIIECARTETTYRAYILGKRTQSSIIIDRLHLSLDRPELIGMLLCDGAKVGSVTGAFAPGSRFLNDSSGAQFSSLQIDAPEAILAINTNGAVFSGGNANVLRLGYNCDKLRFQNMTLTGSCIGGSATQEHYFEKTTLNGTYYENEVHRPAA